MHYLTGIMNNGIHYSEGYNDANWISNVDALYATSEFVFTLASVVVSCKSFK
jgi:hypothetical protein